MERPQAGSDVELQLMENLKAVGVRDEAGIYKWSWNRRRHWQGINRGLV